MGVDSDFLLSTPQSQTDMKAGKMHAYEVRLRKEIMVVVTVSASRRHQGNPDRNIG